ncbi:MAG: hypothetical protein MUF20_00290 [Methylotetracoccus sp.]|nr:hypothetical protein [Methylotetracoccus sp.]
MAALGQVVKPSRVRGPVTLGCRTLVSRIPLRCIRATLLMMLAACSPRYPNRPATWPSAKSGDVCQGHGSVHEWDVFGNDMYVRCKDGTILAH